MGEYGSLSYSKWDCKYHDAVGELRGHLKHLTGGDAGLRICRLKLGDIEFFHLHHRRHGALSARRIGVDEQLGQHLRHDLPR